MIPCIFSWVYACFPVPYLDKPATYPSNTVGNIVFLRNLTSYVSFLMLFSVLTYLELIYDGRLFPRQSTRKLKTWVAHISLLIFIDDSYQRFVRILYGRSMAQTVATLVMMVDLLQIFPGK